MPAQQHPDRLAGTDRLAGPHQRRDRLVCGAQTLRVVDADHPGAGDPTGEGDDSRTRRPHHRCGRGAQVDAPVPGEPRLRRGLERAGDRVWRGDRPVVPGRCGENRSVPGARRHRNHTPHRRTHRHATPHRDHAPHRRTHRHATPHRDHAPHRRTHRHATPHPDHAPHRRTHRTGPHHRTHPAGPRQPRHRAGPHHRTHPAGPRHRARPPRTRSGARANPPGTRPDARGRRQPPEDQHRQRQDRAHRQNNRHGHSVAPAAGAVGVGGDRLCIARVPVDSGRTLAPRTDPGATRTEPRTDPDPTPVPKSGTSTLVTPALPGAPSRHG
jgi:hypothetical protein